MDYTSQSLAFKLKKALRYVKLYGPSRTLIKVKGQYHMKKEYEKLPLLQIPFIVISISRYKMILFPKFRNLMLYKIWLIHIEFSIFCYFFVLINYIILSR